MTDSLLLLTSAAVILSLAGLLALARSIGGSRHRRKTSQLLDQILAGERRHAKSLNEPVPE